MKPDRLVYPITDAVFVTLPNKITAEITNPVVAGHVIKGKVIVAARMSDLAKVLSRAVLDSMATMPKPPQVRRRVVTEAEWSVFTDADQAAAYQLVHDCAECNDGKRQVVEFLREHPGRAAAICKLVYDEHIEATKVGIVGEFVNRGGVMTGDAVPERVGTGEACSMCGDPLDRHEMWLYGDPNVPGGPPGRMTCPVEGCACQSEFSFTPQP